MDIGSLLYFGALAVWSGAVAYFVLQKFLPARESDKVSVPEVASPVFPIHNPAPVVSEELVKPPMPDYQMTEGFKSFQTGAELTVEDIVKGLSRRAP